jgi:hypothetical protein
MKLPTHFVLSVLILFEWLGATQFGRCDFIIYGLPGSKGKLILEGATKVQGPNLIQFTSPGFPSIVLSREFATPVKAPTRLEEFKRLFQKATRSNQIDDFLEAAKQALQRGLIKEFRECCSAAYKIDPKHPTVVRLIEARKLIKVPLTSPGNVEQQLKETTNLKKMKMTRSDHYVMMHDTSDAKIGRKKQTRAETRLELLELVYESYFMKFALDGIVLQPPTEHLMVLLFDDEKNYLRYATELSPELKMASGFWSPKDNIGVFYDQGTTEEMKILTELTDELQAIKKKVRGKMDSREIAYLANSLELIVNIKKEESDIEVVSHEATHQLAGNTGVRS